MKKQLHYLIWTAAYYWMLLSIGALGLWYSTLFFIKKRRPARRLNRKELEGLRKSLNRKRGSR